MEMAMIPPASRTKKQQLGAASGPVPASDSLSLFAPGDVAGNGVRGGAKTQLVSFHALAALIAPAKRETGISSTCELCMLALVVLAGRDPMAGAFRCTEGLLGPDHNLEF